MRELKAGRLRFAAEDPDAPENFPRILTLWRSNLLGSSSKGHEFFLKHLLGVPDAAVRSEESPEHLRPKEVVWRDAPEGKLDLLVTIDFRKNGSSLYSDIVLPTATWYEKHDISSTDMHPFVHPFNPAITPPWEAKSDWDIFNYVAEVFSGLAKKHLGVRKDLIAAPLSHDTPDELAQPSGKVLDWKKGECEPIPGKTMPKLVVIERDYGAVAEKMTALGPGVENAGIGAKGINWKPEQEVEYLKRRNGTVRGGVGDGRPSLTRTASRRSARRPASDACATSGSSSTTPTRSRPPLPCRTRRICWRPSARCSWTLTIRRWSSRRGSTGSRTIGSRPPSVRPSTSSP